MSSATASSSIRVLKRAAGKTVGVTVASWAPTERQCPVEGGQSQRTTRQHDRCDQPIHVRVCGDRL
ncbi:hypothetical protein C9J85_06645 [Haloferax sp. wsp5]|nr:hypothetical protein C9J85_06645 [Haloferax sp. wsp5]